MGKRSKNNIMIISVVAFLIFAVFVVNKLTPEDEPVESKESGLKYGRYYNEDKSEFVIVSELGYALFYPKREHCYVGYDERYYCDKYDFEDNMLTINIGKAYIRFELVGDTLKCIEYKYAGEVKDVRDANITCKYQDGDNGIVYGIKYRTTDGRTLVVNKNKISLTSYDINSADGGIIAEYTMEGDTIYAGDMLLKYIDGSLYLKESNLFGEYMEYIGDGLRFVPEYEGDGYDWSNEEFLIDRDKYYEEADNLPVPAGHYYNADKTAEIIIGEDGFGKYYPSVDSMASYNGKWEYDGNMLTLTDVSLSHTGYGEDGISWTYQVSQCRFRVNGQKLALTEHIDEYGRSIRYAGEEFIFHYSLNEEVNKLRPGNYEVQYNETECIIGYSFNSDGRGNVEMYISSHDEKWSWQESGQGRGTYEQNGEVINVTFKNGDYAILLLDSGKLVLTDYKLGELGEVKGVAIRLTYVGDGFAKNRIVW